MSRHERSATTVAIDSPAINLRDGIYGCLIGGAIGDALGAPVETLQYDEIRERHGGRVTEFLDGGPLGKKRVAGTVTDDKTVRHYLCLSIVENGGRISPEEWARTLVERMNPDNPFLRARLFVTEWLAIQKLKIGMNPWDAGRGTIPCGTALMAIEPIGIINAGDPYQAYLDAVLIASVTQDGEDRDAAATLAAGVAAALTPGASVDSVVAAMEANSSDVVGRSIIFAKKFAAESSSVDEFADTFYAKLLDWKWLRIPSIGWSPDRYFSASSLEILPASVGIMLMHPDDPNEAIVDGANFGRDCDTIGGIVGALMGSIFGAGALRRDWVESCEAANGDLFEEVDGARDANFARMADRLLEALRQELAQRVTYSTQFLNLIDEATR